MARDFQVFDVVVPVGGTAASPHVTPLSIPPRIVRQVEFMIPFGCSGQVHFALGSTGTRVIPSNNGGYLTGDNEVIHWPMEGFIDSGSWELHAYNTGSYPHTIQVRFLLDLVQQASSVSSGPIPLALLNG